MMMMIDRYKDRTRGLGEEVGMGKTSSLAALSLVGVSCASLASLVGGRDRSPPPRAAPVQEPARSLVSEAALGPLVIRKWRYRNGLEVVLVPDPSATSVAFMTWFRVGSRHEDADAGETGLAHLFEHLMFTQTQKASAPGEFDRRMEEAGAHTNAMTYYDFTAYIDELPPGAVPLAIEMEADRMVNLALTEQQVRTERDVVAEERMGAVDDSVDGTLDETLYGQAFQRHPYRFPVIGRMQDIQAVTKEKATHFYRTFYAPNNAVVVVAGRFEPEAVLDAIERHYGPLPASDNLPAGASEPETAPSQASRSEIRRPVPADRFVMGGPAPALAAPDRAAFEVLDEILTGGPSARLYRQLVVQDEIASSVDGTPSATRDPGLYSLWVQMRRGHRAEEAEAIIAAQMDTLAREPPAEAELVKAKNRIETAFWRALASSEGKASQLGEFEVVAGDYRRLLERPAEIARVAAADVQRAAAQYLAGQPRAVVIARPGPASRR
jgi:zinc protease